MSYYSDFRQLLAEKSNGYVKQRWRSTIHKQPCLANFARTAHRSFFGLATAGICPRCTGERHPLPPFSLFTYARAASAPALCLPKAVLLPFSTFLARSLQRQLSAIRDQ